MPSILMFVLGSNRAPAKNSKAHPKTETNSQGHTANTDTKAHPTTKTKSQEHTVNANLKEHRTTEANSQGHTANTDTKAHPTTEKNSQGHTANTDTKARPTNEKKSQGHTVNTDPKEHPTKETNSQEHTVNTDLKAKPTKEANSHEHTGNTDTNAHPTIVQQPDCNGRPESTQTIHDNVHPTITQESKSKGNPASTNSKGHPTNINSNVHPKKTQEANSKNNPLTTQETDNTVHPTTIHGTYSKLNTTNNPQEHRTNTQEHPTTTQQLQNVHNGPFYSNTTTATPTTQIQHDYFANPAPTQTNCQEAEGGILSDPTKSNYNCYKEKATSIVVATLEKTTNNQHEERDCQTEINARDLYPNESENNCQITQANTETTRLVDSPYLTNGETNLLTTGKETVSVERNNSRTKADIKIEFGDEIESDLVQDGAEVTKTTKTAQTIEDKGTYSRICEVRIAVEIEKEKDESSSFVSVTDKKELNSKSDVALKAIEKDKLLHEKGAISKTIQPYLCQQEQHCTQEEHQHKQDEQQGKQETQQDDKQQYHQKQVNQELEQHPQSTQQQQKQQQQQRSNNHQYEKLQHDQNTEEKLKGLQLEQNHTNQPYSPVANEKHHHYHQHNNPSINYPLEDASNHATVHKTHISSAQIPSSLLWKGLPPSHRLSNPFLYGSRVTLSPGSHAAKSLRLAASSAMLYTPEALRPLASSDASGYLSTGSSRSIHLHSNGDTSNWILGSGTPFGASASIPTRKSSANLKGMGCGKKKCKDCTPTISLRGLLPPVRSGKKGRIRRFSNIETSLTPTSCSSSLGQDSANFDAPVSSYSPVFGNQLSPDPYAHQQPISEKETQLNTNSFFPPITDTQNESTLDLLCAKQHNISGSVREISILVPDIKLHNRKTSICDVPRNSDCINYDSLTFNHSDRVPSYSQRDPPLSHLYPPDICVQIDDNNDYVDGKDISNDDTEEFKMKRCNDAVLSLGDCSSCPPSPGHRKHSDSLSESGYYAMVNVNNSSCRPSLVNIHENFVEMTPKLSETQQLLRDNVEREQETWIYSKLQADLNNSSSRSKKRNKSEPQSPVRQFSTSSMHFHPHSHRKASDDSSIRVSAMDANTLALDRHLLSPGADYYSGVRMRRMQRKYSDYSILSDTSNWFLSGRDFESVYTAHKYTKSEREILASYDSFDYLPSHSEVYKDWIQRQPARLDWDRWLMMGIIGIVIGVAGFMLQQGVHLIGHVKWHRADEYFEHGNLLYAWLWVLGYSLFFVSLSAASVVLFCLPAGGSGVPEVMGFLNGTVVRHFLNLRAFFVKFFSCCCSVGGGMPVGQEGPMIHIGSILGTCLSQFRSRTLGISLPFFQRFRNSEDRRNFTAAGAAAGVASAFTAPVGGLLFGMEEVSSFWSMKLGWMIFFACMLASFTTDIFSSSFKDFQYTGNFGLFVTNKFIIFKLGDAIPVNVIMFLPAAVLGVIGGVLGALFTITNLKIARLRRRLITKIRKPVAQKVVRFIEPLVIMAIWATITVFLPAAFSCKPYDCIPRNQTASPDFYSPENLTGTTDTMYTTASNHHSGGEDTSQRFCPDDPLYSIDEQVQRHMCVKTVTGPDGKVTYVQYNEAASLLNVQGQDALRLLYSRDSHYQFSYASLVTVLCLYFIMTCWASGSAVAGGIVVPMLFVGGLYGRLIGKAVLDLHGGVPVTRFWQWIDPGALALIGSASFFGGVSRLTVSLTVIMIEITNDVAFLLPIMIAIMVAKWVGDYITHPIYHSLLEVKCIPFLDFEPIVYDNHNKLLNLELYKARSVMHSPVLTVTPRESVAHLAHLLLETTHGGFPVVKRIQDVPHELAYGLLTRTELCVLLCDQSIQKQTSPGITITPDIPYEEVSIDRIPTCINLVEILEKYVIEPHYMKVYIDLEPYINRSAPRIEENFSLHRTYILFRTLGLRHLTVVDMANRVVGILTRKDLMGFNLEEKLVNRKLRGYSIEGGIAKFLPTEKEYYNGKSYGSKEAV